LSSFMAKAKSLVGFSELSSSGIPRIQTLMDSASPAFRRCLLENELAVAGAAVEPDLAHNNTIIIQ